MTLDPWTLKEELKTLSTEERLALARWLVDTVINETHGSGNAPHSLLTWAGRFEGGPGDTAERAEEILEEEVQPLSGFGRAS